MRRLLFLLLIPCIMVEKTQAQVSLEIEGHRSIALEELAVMTNGTGLGGFVAVSYPLMNSNMFDLVARTRNHQDRHLRDLGLTGINSMIHKRKSFLVESSSWGSQVVRTCPPRPNGHL